MAIDFVEQIKNITIASSGTASEAFQVNKWAIFIGLLIPSIDDGAVGLSICDTSDGTFSPILDPLDGADLVICASGSDPGFIDISDFIRCVPSTWYLKVTCASQTSGAVTVKLVQRG